jgi:hypothetical protein
MTRHKRTAIIVGALFIMAIVLLFVGQAIYEPILGSPTYLEDASPRRTTVVAGILVEFIGVVAAVALIPAFLFPVLKPHGEALALGYLAFRLVEVVLHAVDKLIKLSLIGLSQTYLDGKADLAALHAVGEWAQSASYWAFWLSIVAFGLAALIYYSVSYRARLIPRWISAWGWIAAVLMLVGTVLPELGMLTGLSGSALELVFVLPIALNEMVMATWLIVKGFHPET